MRKLDIHRLLRTFHAEYHVDPVHHPPEGGDHHAPDQRTVLPLFCGDRPDAQMSRTSTKRSSPSSSIVSSAPSNCQTCAVVLIDPQTEYLRIDNAHNLSLTFCNSFRRRIATAAVGELLWTGKPVVIPDAHLRSPLAAEVQLEHPFGSCICVQIAADQRTLGYLHVDSLTPAAFGAADAEICRCSPTSPVWHWPKPAARREPAPRPHGPRNRAGEIRPVPRAPACR